MSLTRDKKTGLKKSGGYYLLVGAIILVIAVVHFGMQLTFIQKETLRSVEIAGEVDVPKENQEQAALPENKVIYIEPQQVEVKKVEIIKVPEYVKPAPVRQRETGVSIRKNEKKIIQPETRSERLRRAERMLTGI